MNLAHANQEGEGKGMTMTSQPTKKTNGSLALLGPQACEPAKGWRPEKTLVISMLMETVPRV